MEIEEMFYWRLANWRRVYGDRPSRWISPTDAFCRYAKTYFDRAKESEEERREREEDELLYRGPLRPAPDYGDAELLQTTWSRMPDWIEGVPAKKNIKIFVFGTARQFDNLVRKAGIPSSRYLQWRNQFIRIFFERVQREEELKKEFGEAFHR